MASSEKRELTPSGPVLRASAELAIKLAGLAEGVVGGGSALLEGRTGEAKVRALRGAALFFAPDALKAVKSVAQVVAEALVHRDEWQRIGEQIDKS